MFADHLGKHLHPETLSQAFERAVARAGLPRIPLHALGKVFVSLSNAAGVHAKVVQANSRHSSITVNQDVYAYAFPEQQRQGMEKLARYVFGEEDTTRVGGDRRGYGCQ